MPFLQRFQSSLDALHDKTDITNYVVAYSGGVDSHVLLHCCSKLNLPVRAVHIHHGLQTVADDWVLHCQQVCDLLKVPLDVIYVDARKKRRQSPEQAARKARYRALGENLVNGDCLLTAQHLDDQAETFLIQLLRASGSAGLSSMPAVKTIGDSRYPHLRPMLDFSRQEIVEFARQNSLQWVEDPSNEDIEYDRNFIRHELLPMLEQRWPNLPARLATVASLQAANLQVLEDMAKIDLAEALSPEQSFSIPSIYETVSRISIKRLKLLSSARLHNLLRYWIKNVLFSKESSLSLTPTRKLLSEIDRTLIHSMLDTNPELYFSVYRFRRYQDKLYLLKTKTNDVIQSEMLWDSSQALELPGLKSRLKVRVGIKNGLDKKLLGEKLKIKFRQGGEHFHPATRQHSKSLKKLFQEEGIPPWQRETIPLVYSGDDFIAVAGLWLANDYTVGEAENGWDIVVESL